MKVAPYDAERQQLSTIEDRRAHNASIPIARLPYDLLIKIFMLNTHIDLESSHQPGRTTRLTSHVQSSWREIIISSPMLWAASLDLANPMVWINEVISRAQHAPFADIIFPSLTPYRTEEICNLAVNKWEIARNGPRPIAELLHDLVTEDISDARLALAVSLIHRCRRFFAKVKKDNWARIVENVSAPSATINTFSVVIKGSHQPDLEDFTLPRDLFGNHAPQLRVVDLRGCGCYLDSPVFHNLTTLVIRKPSSFHVPSANAWMDILANMPKLRVLELHTAFSEPRAAGRGGPVVKVALPHLISVMLSGNFEPVSTVFNNLEFPWQESSMVDIRCYRTRLDTNFYSMLSCIQQRFESLDKSFIQDGLSISCTPTGLGFTCRRLEHQRPDDTLISFDWFSSYAGPNIMAIFPSFLSILKIACPEVQQLRMDIIHSAALSNERIGEILQVFPQVKMLHMAMTDTVERLLPALNRRDTPMTAVPFPLLETVVLEHAFPLGEQEHVADIDGLTLFVQSRRDTSCSIKHVVFANCGQVFSTIRLLESMGAEVTLREQNWDP